MEQLYYVGLDIHKRTISYCVKSHNGEITQEGKLGANRTELDQWREGLPRPWMAAMEATLFTGWIYDHLSQPGAQVKVADPSMRKAIAASKKKNDQVMRAQSPICRGAICYRNAIWHRRRYGSCVGYCATATCWCGNACR
jgi:hypothetical protein